MISTMMKYAFPLCGICSISVNMAPVNALFVFLFYDSSVSKRKFVSSKTEKFLQVVVNDNNIGLRFNFQELVPKL